MSGEQGSDGIGAELDRHRAELVRFVGKRAGGALLRMESSDDLAQDVCARALAAAATFERRTEASFRAWLFEIARNHLADRRDYWSALKRSGTQVLRLGAVEGAEESSSGIRDLAASVTGPSTFAVRREQLALATRALSLLLPRDRELLEGLASGTSARAQADQLAETTAAVESARKRALERFRKTFQLVSRGRSTVGGG